MCPKCGNINIKYKRTITCKGISEIWKCKCGFSREKYVGKNIYNWSGNHLATMLSSYNLQST